MRKMASFIVDKRKIILIVFALLIICSAYFMTKVSVNSDMTKYLPDDSSTKIGASIMEDEFPAVSSLSVMIHDLKEDELEQAQITLEKIPNVTDVKYEKENDDYNRDEYTLFILTIDAGSYSQEAKDVVKEVKETFDDINLSGDAASKGELDTLLPALISIALPILLVILFLMCESWLEPFLFLLTIGIAIILNMGTNAVFESISDITNAIAAILQVCLSMDYSIMLMNRYRQEKKISNNKFEAMKNAIINAFVPISSSSVTTIVGMLALVFMSFTIGRDLGIVLAKGVFFSLLCIFTVLPAFVVLFDKAIEKTSKKSLPIKMDWLGKFSFHARYIISGAFVVLFVASLLLRNSVNITYTMGEFDKVKLVFESENQIVLVYKNDAEDKISVLSEKLLGNENIGSINAYSNTLGMKLTYIEFAEKTGMDESLVAMMYNQYLNKDQEIQEIKIPFGSFIEFLSTDVAKNPQFSTLFTEEALAQLGQMSAGFDMQMMAMELTSAEAAAYINMDEAIVAQLYNYYSILHGFVPEEKITFYDFMQFIITDIAKNEQYKEYFTDDILTELESAKEEMDDGLINLVGKNYSRMIINTNLPEESEETFNFISELKSEASNIIGNDFYIVGNSVMAYDMHKTFPAELNYITILTAAALFVVVAISFLSLCAPAILVAIIQCAVFITMGSVYIQGSSIYYLPLLIVQCLLMGATIDYGILFTSYYREARMTYDKKNSLIKALNESIHTILTSSLILISITLSIGLILINDNHSVSEILLIIARGGIFATFLVVFVLPGLLCTFDKFVIKKK